MPGVLPYADFKQRRAMWDEVRQCIGLDAEFWEGAEALLFPPEWLNRAERIAEDVRYLRKREAKAVGIDPAEGGDDTTMAAVDELGLIELTACKTPDTSVIRGAVKDFGRRHGVPPDKWVFDRGGGGKQISDQLRSEGFPVRTVAFGEPVSLEPRHGLTTIAERVALAEERYVYKNRRAQMYGDLSVMLDPGRDQGWGLPVEYGELRRQLALIPKLLDHEGRLYLPPKRKKTAKSTEVSLEEIIGCSPDEADAVVLALYGMQHLRKLPRAGAI